MSRPDHGLCSCKIMDLRAVAKRLRETAQFVDGLLPIDPKEKERRGVASEKATRKAEGCEDAQWR